MPTTLDFKFREVLPYLRENGRLNVLIALLLRANVRNRCYPSMRLIAKDTGYGLEAVTEAKKWLEAHGAIEIVKVAQRVGDEKTKIKSNRQHVYQLTGVIEINNTSYPYLYVSPTEISESEISPTETEVVKDSKSLKKRKETTFAPASQDASASTDWPQDIEVSYLSGAQSESPSLKGKDSKAEDTTALSPIPDAPLSQAAPKKRSEKQLRNDALLDAIRIAFFKGRGLPIPDTVPNSEISLYMKRANELVSGGISPENFLSYVQYWHKAAVTWPNGLTLNSLTNNGRIGDFLAFSAKNPTGQSNTLPAYRSYSPQNDVAYGADSDGSQ